MNEPIGHQPGPDHPYPAPAEPPASTTGQQETVWISEHSESEMKALYLAAHDHDCPEHMRGESFETWAEAEGYTRLPASAQPQQEPVAWRWKLDESWDYWHVETTRPQFVPGGDAEKTAIVEPLYLAPSAQHESAGEKKNG